MNFGVLVFSPENCFIVAQSTEPIAFAFAEKGRREVQIPDVRALSAFVQQCLAPVPTLQ